METKVSDHEIVKKWQSLRSSATSRDIDFNLSLKKVKQLLLADKCYYTGIKFVAGHPDLGKSIDQVIPSLGYFDDNVVPCISRINNLKTNIHYRELILVLKGVEKHFKKHKIDPKLEKTKALRYEPAKTAVIAAQPIN